MLSLGIKTKSTLVAALAGTAMMFLGRRQA
jgi:hypothetical protein